MLSLKPLLEPRSLAQHPCTIRTGPDGRRAARIRLPGSAMIRLRGRQPSKLVYAGNLAESDMARARSMPSLRPRAKRPLSK